MSLYRVTAERTAKWWVLQAVEAPGAISQVARLDQADVIKEAIAFVTGEPEDSIEIEVEPVLPDAIADSIDEVEQLREQARVANAAAAERSRDVARALHVFLGLSLRDVGAVLEVSHQRAHQLAAEGTAEAWLRLGQRERNWLVHNAGAPVPADVWNAMQAARFVEWWGKLNDDNTHDLDRHAWEWIKQHGDAVPA